MKNPLQKRGFVVPTGFEPVTCGLESFVENFKLKPTLYPAELRNHFTSIYYYL